MSIKGLNFQGLIDFLVSKHKIAQELRKKLIFKVIPMMNPDGVYLGNYRGSLLGKLFMKFHYSQFENYSGQMNTRNRPE